jgi:hypothetical protein
VTTVTSFQGITGDEPAASSDSGDPHKVLINLNARISAEAKAGLHPKGHPDCQWGARYPAEYMAALSYFRHDRKDESRAFEILSGVVYKIEAEAIRGTPLVCADGLEWVEGSFPAEFLAARDLIRKQAEKDTEDLGSDSVYRI